MCYLFIYLYRSIWFSIANLNRVLHRCMGGLIFGKELTNGVSIFSLGVVWLVGKGAPSSSLVVAQRTWPGSVESPRSFFDSLESWNSNFFSSSLGYPTVGIHSLSGESFRVEMSCIKQDFPRTFAVGSKSLSETSPGWGY